ncbi:hypothetical protein [Salinicoccus sesuvii]
MKEREEDGDEDAVETKEAETVNEVPETQTNARTLAARQHSNKQ